MAVLHNRVNRRILKQQLRVDGGERMTLSFYKYHRIDEPDQFRDRLYKVWKPMGVLGRTYVAHEGINAQVSLPRQAFDAFRRSLDDTGFLKGVRLNVAVEDDGKSFFVLKIAVKRKIVADGITDDRFDAAHSGTHLDATAFNKLAGERGTIVVDMRNHYESEVGHFRDAICPDVDTFREALPVVEHLLVDKKDNNIIMYCTGGIRCEKASAWMLHRGFKNVFQLDGGIIEYARQVKAEGLENKFIGKNFVFDERMGERISPEIISVCHQCGTPCDNHTNCINDGCHLLFIQCRECAGKYNGCCSEACQEIVALPAEKQRELRKGKAQLRKVYKKGRATGIKPSRNA